MNFYKNTFFDRRGNPSFRFFHTGVATAPTITDNIFSAGYSSGDAWGPNCLTTNTTRNVFHNIPVKGTAGVAAGSQPLPTTGGFPAAYVPAPAYAAYGAFADGLFVVGIQ